MASNSASGMLTMQSVANDISGPYSHSRAALSFKHIPERGDASAPAPDGRNAPGAQRIHDPTGGSDAANLVGLDDRQHIRGEPIRTADFRIASARGRRARVVRVLHRVDDMNRCTREGDDLSLSSLGHLAETALEKA